MLAVTGPVISNPSAWRGEATNWMPKRERSKTTVFRTFTSTSHPLHPPALTWRSFSERPNRRSACRSRARASRTVSPSITRSSLVRAAIRWSGENRPAPAGQAFSHSPQKRHRPRSSASRPPSRRRAPVGQVSTQERHPSGHFAGSRTGRPRNLSGIGGTLEGYRRVRLPWRSRSRNAFSMASASQVVPAVREIEALVAEREVGDRLQPHRIRERRPVVEGRIDDLVAGEASALVGRRDVADLATPSLDERDGDCHRLEGAGVLANGTSGDACELRVDEPRRLLRFEPPHLGAGED